MDKHIVNDPKNLASEALLALARVRPDLSVDPAYRVVSRIHNQVGILSGGGSGHEPSFGGFVGNGCLTTAVAGNIFASPNVKQIVRGVELAAQGGQGLLIIIMRYTGDVLHFGLAKEQFSVSHPKEETRLLIVGDDVAVSRTQGAITGRRGLAGTVLVHKVAGASAARGDALDTVYDVAANIASRVGTIGCGLGHCSLPGSTSSSHDGSLGSDEIEIGMGIHNEPGVKIVKLSNTRSLVREMLTYIIDTEDSERAFLNFEQDGKDEVVLLVNNLGGLSELEILAIAAEAVDALAERSITVVRIGVGRYMTSINLPGFSVTTLLLPRDGDQGATSQEIVSLLDAPCDAIGWTPLHPPRSRDQVSPQASSADEHDIAQRQSEATGPAYDTDLLSRILRSACNNVIKAEADITRFDTIAGDGDCGLCLKAGALEILRLIDQSQIPQGDIVGAISAIAQGVEREMDGTSGALYSIWLNALAAGFRSATTVDTTTSTKALSYSLSVLSSYTNARPPSRTLMDPLFAFTESLAASQDFEAAVEAAVAATEATKSIAAKAGRAAYVEQDQLKNAQVPDPGAYGVVKILEGMQSVLASP